MPAASAMRDQTMDEILASIHRMIADGGAAGPATPDFASPSSAAAPVTSAAGDPNDASDTEDWMAAQVAAVLGETVRTAVAAAAVTPEPEPLERRVGRRFVDGLAAGPEDVALIATEQKVETRMSEQQRLSDQANGSVGASFETLSRTILSQNPRTLEDLVRDLLRPMLRTWLDQNLPRMVERMVKQEIDRISRGER